MKYILIWIIKIYKKIPGKFHDNCHFYPTCSTYAIEAISEYGSIKGGILAIKRIIKCNPFGDFKYDPIPKKEIK